MLTIAIVLTILPFVFLVGYICGGVAQTNKQAEVNNELSQAEGDSSVDLYCEAMEAKYGELDVRG